jgi:sulfur carrier protein ThiS
MGAPLSLLENGQTLKSPGLLPVPMRIIAETRSGREGLEMPEGASPMEVLARLCLLPDAHIVLRSGVPVPIDEVLADGDVLKVVKVASGG